MSDLVLRNPPVVEFSMGVQFARLMQFRTGHLGRFWQYLGTEEWPDATDDLPIDDQFEQFETPRWALPPSIPIRISPLQVNRLRMQHKSNEKMIQVQPTRLHYNWVKSPSQKPSYSTLSEEFFTVYEQLRGFASSANLGDIQANQWELTYVNAFAEGEEWTNPADWSNVLPGLFSPLFSDDQSMDMNIDYRNAAWSFEIPSKLGRVHISAYPGIRPQDDRSSLILTTTARGPVSDGGVDAVREGLNLGHDKLIKVFLSVVNKTFLEKWR